jgi:hypothetical protein
MTKWTKEDINNLKTKYPKNGTKIPELTDKFSVSAIKTKARILNIKKQTWTEEEIKILKEKYQKNGCKIPELLNNKTQSSIVCKAHKLGIKSNVRSIPRKWTDERIHKLKQDYKQKGTDIPELLEIFSRNAIMIAARNLNLKCHKKINKKFDISKDELVELYTNQKKSTTQIAKIYNCSFNTIVSRLEGYNIQIRKRKDSICIVRGYHKNIKLNDYILQIMDGILLSDGGYDFGGKDKKTASLKITQMESHREWLDELKSIFENNNIECSMVHRFSRPIDKSFPQWVLKTRYYLELGDERKRWYPKGKKIVPKDVRITPLVLAQWYMGDGNLSATGGTKSGKKFYRLSLCTDSFTKEENEFLRDKLKKLYGWNFRVFKYRNSSYRLVINLPKEIKDFLFKTAPYKVECFNYKWEALYDINYAPIRTEWTKRKDMIIIKKFPENGTNIRELLDDGISEYAIQHRAIKLGVKCNYIFNQSGKTKRKNS